MEYQPKISIVVLTFNSGATLNACLQALEELDYPQELLEIILLDNGSKDNTIEIIERFGLPFLSLPDLNLSQLRNHGADVSTGEIIAYIDSDCVVAKDWCRQIAKWFKDPSVGIVGNEYLLPDNPTLFEKNWYNQCNSGVKDDDLIPAGNMALKKIYFHQLGGFDNSLATGEDDYILEKFRKHGFRTISDHQVHSKHLGNAKTLRQYFHKETWYGLGMLGTVHLAKFNKPLVATILFSASVFFFLVLFLLYCLSSAHGILLFSSLAALLCAFSLAFLSAIERVYRKKRKGNLFYVTLAFMVFFAARTKSLLMILMKNLKSK